MQIHQLSAIPSYPLLKLNGFINSHPAVILLDSGASGSFVSSSFVSSHGIVADVLAEPGIITLADGHQQQTGSIMQSAKVRIGSYADSLVLAVIPLPGYDAIIGMNWLTRYNPLIDWVHHTVVFDDRDSRVRHTLVGSPLALSASDRSSSSKNKKKSHSSSLTVVTSSLNTISVRQVKALHRNRELDFACLVYPQDVEAIAIVASSSSSSSSSSVDNRVNNIVSSSEKTFATERAKILSQFRDVFPDQLPAGLPPSREVDHKIELVANSSPPSRPTFRMSESELVELK